MGTEHTIRRIVWAVDPFAEDVELQRRTAEAVCAVSANAGAGSADANGVAIEPVSIIYWDDRSVLSTTHPTASASISSNASTDIQGAAAIAVNKMIQQFGIKRALPPTILVQGDLSLGKAVRRLIQHAKESETDLIAVGTQARTGATRFLLGSFAETLILQSDVPTLVVSPKSKPIQKINHILYPTDLSRKSVDAFSDVVTLAKRLGASITVFHRVEYQSLGPVGLIPAPPIFIESYKTDVSLREKESGMLAARARATGIDVNIKVEHQGAGALDAILELSEGMESGLIAMVSQSSSVKSILLGSITRQVIRHAHCPVWVIHPKLKALK